MTAQGFFGALLVGLIIGALGRLVVPGRQPIGCLLTILLGTNIASEATLSFLGIGLKGNAISWGISIAEAGPFARVEPGPLIWPSLFLAATVLAFIMLGDAVRDAFDPKLR